MQDIIATFLQDYGFTANERRVYLDVYKYGQSYASTVATRTGIDRTTVYSVLKKLVKEGVLIQTSSGETRAYMAVSPRIFMDKLDRAVEDLNLRKRGTRVFIEQMEGITRRVFLKPRTRIYEGAEAVMTLYRHTVATPGMQKSFLTLQWIPAELKDFLRREFIKLKIANNVRSNVLVAQSPAAQKYKTLDAKSNRQTKIISKHPFDLHSEIILCGGSEIAIIDFHETIYGIVIESHTLCKSMEMLFDYIWSNE